LWVVVDDRIPCEKGTKCPCFSQVRRGVVWVCVLEKALAKFCGSYNQLDTGDESWAWQVLTGTKEPLFFLKAENLLSSLTQGHKKLKALYFAGPQERSNPGWCEFKVDSLCQYAFARLWRSCGMKSTPIKWGQALLCHKESSDSLFKTLAVFDQANCLMSAAVNSDSEVHREDGLCEGHSYSVLQLQKVYGKCMIQLRNPWGDGSGWNGKFSACCSEWERNPQMAKDLQTHQMGPGIFWMAWEDFVTIFDNVSVSSGSLPFPKQATVGEVHGDGLRCAICDRTIVRLWWMTDFKKGRTGTWIKLQEGDVCLPCRRAQRGLMQFRVADIPGIDSFPRHIRVFELEPPRKLPICEQGPLCCNYDVDHLEAFAHPWLGSWSSRSFAKELGLFVDSIALTSMLNINSRTGFMKFLHQ